MSLLVMKGDFTPPELLKCIRVSRTNRDGYTHYSYMTKERYKDEFLVIRKKKSRYSNVKSIAFFGMVYHRITLNDTTGVKYCTYDFDFPSTLQEARERHNAHYEIISIKNLDGVIDTTRKILNTFLTETNDKRDIDTFLNTCSFIDIDSYRKWLQGETPNLYSSIH